MISHHKDNQNLCCNTDANEHSGHSSYMRNHDSAEDFLRRFFIVTFLLFGKYISFGIATIIFSFSLVFFKHAWHEIKAKKYGMMTLVSLAVGAGYLFSAVSTFLPSLEAEFYLEISTLIWVLLFGHYLEARSSSSAGNALSEVAKLLPKKARLIKDGREEEIDIENLTEGDIALVKPGKKIPADGVIKDGEANIDEALISGESKPIKKKSGEEVIAGSINIDGALTIRIIRVGEHSTIGQIQKLISSAQKTKPNAQRIADKASAVLTFTAGITALITILVWAVQKKHPKKEL